MRVALQGVLWLMAALLVAAATLPWWLGLAAGPLLRGRGVTYERYERLGYWRAAWHDVEVARPAFRVRIQRVESATPLAWLGRRAALPVQVAGWELQFIPASERATPDAAPTAKPERSVAEVHAQLRRVADQLERWLPDVRAENGTLVRGAQRFALPRARWFGGELQAEGQLPTGDAITVTWAREAETFRLRSAVPSLGATADLRWIEAKIRGSGTWWEQPWQLEAEFGPRGWVPTAATIAGSDWDVPGSRLKLGAQYAQVQGNFRGEWRDAQWDLQVRAHAEARRDAQAPPLDLVARARGDRSRAIVHELALNAPFGRARLDAPLEVPLEKQGSAQAANLTVEVDLAQQPWIAAQGRVEGRVEMQAGEDWRGAFSLAARDVQLREFPVRAARLTGTWQWPQITVESLTAEFNETARAEGRGALDWSRRELRDVRIFAQGSATAFRRWLPKGVAWENLAVDAELAGPLEAPRHRGRLNASHVILPQLQPVELTAEWEGQERALAPLRVEARAGDSQLTLTARVDERRADVEQLTWLADGERVLQLSTPGEVTWRPMLAVRGLRWSGADHHLHADFEWSERPRFQFNGRNLPSAWLADWLAQPLPVAGRVEELLAHGATDAAGVLQGEIDGRFSVQHQAVGADVVVAATADASGVRVQRLEARNANGLLTEAVAAVPVQIQWRNAPRLRWDETAPLELNAAVSADSPVWPLVAERFGWEIAGASVRADLRGSLRAPQGAVHLAAERLGRTAGEKLPALTDLKVLVRATRDRLSVDEASVRVEDHPIIARAQLPMDDAAWRTLLSEPAHFDWARARAEAKLESVDLRVAAQTLPQLPLAGGTLDAELAWADGALQGAARLRDGATRPITGLGVVQAIQAEVGVRDRTLAVNSFHAELGGEPIEVEGRATLSAEKRVDLDLRARGRNVPVVRRPGVLVRTDFDLRAETNARGVARVSGTVDLQDALVMADLAAILPRGPRGATRQPPYFFVAAEPFARWPLDVAIRGDRAVRIRTAVFNGVATPQFRLRGTLGEPRAVGQLAVDDGFVIFPFARFEVQQGAVRLTEADPTQPQLAVNATARRLGYELRMEAAGTLNSPTLAFTSNPPLESAQILLLVTAGQPPTDETSASGEQRLTRLGTFLGRGLFQNLGGGDAERLEITSGEQLSREGRETYRVEYKLREKLSLTGEYDEYDNYNAGVKWRLYTQEGADDEKRR